MQTARTRRPRRPLHASVESPQQRDVEMFQLVGARVDPGEPDILASHPPTGSVLTISGPFRQCLSV